MLVGRIFYLAHVSFAFFFSRSTQRAALEQGVFFFEGYVSI